jgi:hypothetical protein
MMDPATHPEQFLKRAIRLARRLERELPPRSLRHHKVFLGLGFLVRNRRIAQAIARLGTAHAYEGRMLLRSMIEIQINYSWIRLDRTHSRALRFMRYEPIERLHIVSDIQSVLSPERAAAVIKRFTREREGARHLFRVPAAKGKRKWASSWASIPALKDRYTEILRREGGDASDTFVYGIYRWASSAVHGGPVSLSEVLVTSEDGARAQRQPEKDPQAQIKSAAAILLLNINQLGRDARMIRALMPDLRELGKAAQALRAVPGPRPRGA